MRFIESLRSMSEQEKENKMKILRDTNERLNVRMNSILEEIIQFKQNSCPISSTNLKTHCPP